MSVAVTDTHALIWYAMGPSRKLGKRARALFAEAERGRATIYVPSLVLVEVAEAMRRGVITCDGGFSRWAERLLGSGHFPCADLSAGVVLEAEALYGIPERGDRLIAATAAHMRMPLITRDPAMARMASIATIW